MAILSRILMGGLETQVHSLSAQLRAEMDEGTDTRRLHRESKRGSKVLRKALGDADICLWFGLSCCRLQKALYLRKHCINRQSSYTAVISFISDAAFFASHREDRLNLALSTTYLSFCWKCCSRCGRSTSLARYCGRLKQKV